MFAALLSLHLVYINLWMAFYQHNRLVLYAFRIMSQDLGFIVCFNALSLTGHFYNDLESVFSQVIAF